MMHSSVAVGLIPLGFLACASACAPRVPDDVSVSAGAVDLHQPRPAPYAGVTLTWHPNPVHVVVESMPPPQRPPR